jgi:plastocyanin
MSMTPSLSRSKLAAFTLMALLTLSASAVATTHVVQFGGGVGFTYSPSQFSATVGDTVKWEGEFAMHPLSSTSVPAGAQTWHNASGTSFSYMIEIPGSYAYHCDFHASIGMTGTFVATALSVRDVRTTDESGSTSRVRILNVVTNGAPAVRFVVAQSGVVSVTVHDLLGHTRTIVDAFAGPGGYEVPLGIDGRNDGIYIVRVTNDAAADTRVFGLLR